MNQSYNFQILKHVIAWLIAMTTVLTSCIPAEQTPSVGIGDGGFLSQEPCGPPCFMGITPGVTTELDALKIIGEICDLKECSTWKATPDGVQKGIRCDQAFAISFDSAGIVAVVSFTPQQTITVQDVILKLGIPDAVGTALAASDYEDPTIVLVMFYRNLYTQISLPDQEGYQYELTPETEIKGILYYDEENYNRLLDFTQPWKGFGLYY